MTVNKILTNYSVWQLEEKKHEENQCIGMIIAREVAEILLY